MENLAVDGQFKIFVVVNCESRNIIESLKRKFEGVLN